MDMKKRFAQLGGIRPVVGNKLAPMTDVEVARLEEQLNVEFPKSYRSFLATYGASAFNGASPDNPFIRFRSLKPLPPNVSNNDKGLFSIFYGADVNEGYGLSTRIRFYSGRMPESIVPIGDCWGNQICLGISGNEAGKVYYWDQENEPQSEQEYMADFGKSIPPEAKFQNVYLIAESFEDFLQRLELSEDD
jgi:hypothetical protein